jgi:hypothetical protein
MIPLNTLAHYSIPLDGRLNSPLGVVSRPSLAFLMIQPFRACLLPFCHSKQIIGMCSSDGRMAKPEGSW